MQLMNGPCNKAYQYYTSISNSVFKCQKIQNLSQDQQGLCWET